VGYCLGPEGNGVDPEGREREGSAPQMESKISSLLPAGKKSTATWSKRKRGRRVRRNKEDSSCTE
jgi:hypothetical protein